VGCILQTDLQPGQKGVALPGAVRSPHRNHQPAHPGNKERYRHLPLSGIEKWCMEDHDSAGRRIPAPLFAACPPAGISQDALLRPLEFGQPGNTEEGATVTGTEKQKEGRGKAGSAGTGAQKHLPLLQGRDDGDHLLVAEKAAQPDDLSRKQGIKIQ